MVRVLEGSDDGIKVEVSNYGEVIKLEVFQNLGERCAKVFWMETIIKKYIIVFMYKTKIYSNGMLGYLIERKILIYKNYWKSLLHTYCTLRCNFYSYL